VLDTVSRSRSTAEFPAGNPATRCLLRGPEALRHCLATVLPIAVFRRYVSRLVMMVDYNRGRVNRDTTNGPVGPTSGLSCGSQHPKSRSLATVRRNAIGRFASTACAATDAHCPCEALARRAPGASRPRACSPVVETDNRATTLTGTTELAGNCRCPGKYRPACTSPGLRPEYSRNRTARTRPAGFWPFAGTYRMSCLRACRRSHKPTKVHRGLRLQAIRLWSSSWYLPFSSICDWNADVRFKAGDHSNIRNLSSLRLRSADPILVHSHPLQLPTGASQPAATRSAITALRNRVASPPVTTR